MDHSSENSAALSGDYELASEELQSVVCYMQWLAFASRVCQVAERTVLPLACRELTASECSALSRALAHLESHHGFQVAPLAKPSRPQISTNVARWQPLGAHVLTRAIECDCSSLLLRLNRRNLKYSCRRAEHLIRAREVQSSSSSSSITLGARRCSRAPD